MKNQNLDENQIDKLVADLLTAPAPAPRKNFTDSVMAEIEKISQEEKRLDNTIDTLLGKKQDFANITESTIEQVKKRPYGIFEQITSLSVAASIVICAIISAVMISSNSGFPKGVLSEDDFAEMSKIDEEINNLTLLVMQEEILDIVRRR